MHSQTATANPRYDKHVSSLVAGFPALSPRQVKRVSSLLKLSAQQTIIGDLK